MEPLVPWAIAAAAVLVLAWRAVPRVLYYRSGTAWPPHAPDRDAPRPLRLGPLDYVKALACWLDGYRRTFALEPGLYYLGERHDPDAPLLVTSNYHLTVFLVARHARAAGARLLVVDTDGINVWCAAGKGTFGNDAILAQVHRYDRALLFGDGKPTLLLPKVGMAGVDLRALRKARLRPIIGPVYAKDLPGYLAGPRPLRDRPREDIVRFGLQMRAFTWPPGLVQYLGWTGVPALAAYGAGLPVDPALLAGAVALTATVATAYPLLFPWIPGRRFAVKGLVLGVAFAAALATAASQGLIRPAAALIGAPFSLAVGIWFALSYTGNSAVSAYTRVRAEMGRFLVPDVVLFALTLAALVLFGGAGAGGGAGGAVGLP